MTGLTRRSALGLLGAGALTAACGSDLNGTVRVGVVWSGAELAQFRRALRLFTRQRLWGVSVVSLGDDVATLLERRAARGVAPEVAILPQPSLVAAKAGALAELTDRTPGGVNPEWRTLASPGGTTRGVWYKATHKSLVWYRTDEFDRLGLEAPEDWDDWVRMRARCAERGVALLSIGAADGWVLTDWFENVLWGHAPDTYRKLATGTAGWDPGKVAGALTLLADLWTADGTLPGGIARALSTQFEDSVLDVVVRREAAMVAGADFVYPVVRRLAPQVAESRLAWFRMPPPPSGLTPLIVGGDLAVLLADAGPGGRELVDWLAGAQAAGDWAAAGGFVSLRGDVTGYPTAYRGLVGEVRRGDPDGRLAFDLSDRRVGGPSGGDGPGLARLLQRFLADLRRGGDSGRAVENTVAALERIG